MVWYISDFFQFLTSLLLAYESRSHICLRHGIMVLWFCEFTRCSNICLLIVGCKHQLIPKPTVINHCNYYLMPTSSIHNIIIWLTCLRLTDAFHTPATLKDRSWDEACL